MIRKIFLRLIPGRIAIVIVCFVLLSEISFAQGQFEVSGSIGGLSGIQMVRAIGQALGGGSDRVPEYDNGGSPNYLLSAKYFFSKRMAVGITFGLETINGESNSDYTMASSSPQYSYNRTYYTIAPEMEFVYVNRRWFRFYALFGAGVALVKEQYDYYQGGSNPENKTNSVSPNMQITPLGLGFGGRLKGNIEVGLGYKGLLNCGISYNF